MSSDRPLSESLREMEVDKNRFLRESFRDFAENEEDEGVIFGDRKNI